MDRTEAANRKKKSKNDKAGVPQGPDCSETSHVKGLFCWSPNGPTLAADVVGFFKGRTFNITIPNAMK